MTKYTVKPTSRFIKELKRCKKQGKNLTELEQVITKIANGDKLSPKNNDHALKGKWAGYRECHITPDWLLIYKIFDDILVLSLVTIGSHSDLF